MSRFAFAFLALLSSSCTTHWRAAFVEPTDYAAIKSDASFLKAHMTDGTVYVLEKWSVSASDRTLQGEGLHYSVSRRSKDLGTWTVPFDAVALVETNQPETVVSTGLVVMGVVTGISLAVTAACIANRKMCFGSCPTFYARPDGPILAEGFSSSIARTLEATDVDALPIELGAGAPRVSLWMKNEALETHVVRSVRLLAVPLGAETTVVRGADGYFPVRALASPGSCRSQDGDCTGQVAAADDRAEFRSETDATDLAASETVELVFSEAPKGPVGVLIRARSSLSETYAFYQLMAYLGLRADDWFLQLEQLGKSGSDLVEEMVGMLGRIEVEVHTAGGWRHAGTFREVGPLAFDDFVVPVQGTLAAAPVRVRLTLARGAWKVDQVALASLGAPVKAVPVELTAVSKSDRPRPDVAKTLLARSAPLVTYPGDLYRFDFELPPGRQQVFLESRGYYYEWMREGWLPEESADHFVDAIWNPAAYFKRIAPGYKRMEPHIEELFWNSRVEAK